jgi:three-Cys-motif partner protein
VICNLKIGDDIQRRNIVLAMAHSFGGKWTQEKLERVGNYLQTYSTALKNQSFKRIYVDAFAGTGYVNVKEKQNNPLLFPEFKESEVQEFVAGSAQIALNVNPPFDEYIFIEKDENRFSELGKLKEDFPNLANNISFQFSDANNFLQSFCNSNWANKRAVVFLDPYGMQVKWETIEAIAKTQAIDLWILFPLGVAVNRLLKRDGNISESVKNRLDEVFGTKEWFNEFFQEKTQPSFFEDNSGFEKTANFESIANFYNERLKSLFAGVAKKPLKLLNSKNNPLYLLCFAVGNPNPKAQGLALKFANHILQMR